MYDIKFVTASGSDWAEIVEAVDADTNQPLTDLASATIELHVSDDCDRVLLSASTADGTITRPEPGQFQWRFTKEQMAALCHGKTYPVGCRITTDTDGTGALFIGSVAVLDGEFA